MWWWVERNWPLVCCFLSLEILHLYSTVCPDRIAWPHQSVSTRSRPHFLHTFTPPPSHFKDACLRGRSPSPISVIFFRTSQMPVNFPQASSTHRFSQKTVIPSPSSDIVWCLDKLIYGNDTYLCGIKYGLDTCWLIVENRWISNCQYHSHQG